VAPPQPRAATPPSSVQLLEQAGTARQWWGTIAAFLADGYRARTAVRWLPDVQAWGQTYLKGSVILAHVVPQAGAVMAFVPFSVSAVKRALAHPDLLDDQARLTFNNYLAGKVTMPAVRVTSDDDADAVVRLVSLAHPRKGHPCGSA
jgi:hypothetical protein